MGFLKNAYLMQILRQWRKDYMDCVYMPIRRLIEIMKLLNFLFII